MREKEGDGSGLVVFAINAGPLERSELQATIIEPRPLTRASEYRPKQMEEREDRDRVGAPIPHEFKHGWEALSANKKTRQRRVWGPGVFSDLTYPTT